MLVSITYRILRFGETYWFPSSACIHHQCLPWNLVAEFEMVIKRFWEKKGCFCNAIIVRFTFPPSHMWSIYMVFVGKGPGEILY